MNRELISITPLFAILVSTISAGLISASRDKPNLREFWSIAAGIIKFILVVSMAPAILAGNTLEYTLFSILPGLEIKFRVDALGLLFATTSSFLWILTSFYSIGYMRSLREHAQTRYFACFAVAMSATMGVAFCANLFTLFLFYEILSMVTYPLVIHKETPEAFAAGRKYIVYLFGASKTFLLAALILTYLMAGTLEFKEGGIFPGGASPRLLTVVYILFMAGFVKAAIMPLHNWLPTAMIAPTPVSALLHAVAVVKVGVFSILRVMFHVFGLDLMGSLHLGTGTAYVASFTILMASIIALTRDNLKARLAYSTISQLSYIILGAALMTPSSMMGGMLQIVNHAFAKITLFFCAGSIYVVSHKEKISELSGIGKAMPWTMLAFSIGALGMIGVPPVGGYLSKWYLAVGTMEAGEIPLLLVLLASAILNAAYFLPIIYKAFFEEPEETLHGGEMKEAPPFVLVPLVCTGIGAILLGLYPEFFIQLAKEVIR